VHAGEHRRIECLRQRLERRHYDRRLRHEHVQTDKGTELVNNADGDGGLGRQVARRGDRPARSLPSPHVRRDQPRRPVLRTLRRADARPATSSYFPAPAPRRDAGTVRITGAASSSPSDDGGSAASRSTCGTRLLVPKPASTARRVSQRVGTRLAESPNAGPSHVGGAAWRFRHSSRRVPESARIGAHPRTSGPSDARPKRRESPAKRGFTR
jgi:hypothetical protein